MSGRSSSCDKVLPEHLNLTVNCVFNFEIPLTSKLDKSSFRDDSFSCVVSFPLQKVLA